MNGSFYLLLVIIILQLIQLIQIMSEVKPIYIQIKEYYEHLIDIGGLVDNEEMPSVRAVALMMNANPNTVQRAFTLMVEDGYLVSIPKKGFYVVSKNKTKNKELRKQLQLLKDSGITKEEILKELDDIYD